MTLLEALTGVIAITLMVGVFVLTRLALRIGRASDDVALAARRVEELSPAARDLIENGRTALETLRSLTGTTTRIAEDVRTVTEQASAVTSQVLRGFESEIAGRYRAVFAGARAGFDVLRRFGGGNGSHGSKFVEVEEFDHADK